MFLLRHLLEYVVCIEQQIHPLISKTSKIRLKSGRIKRKSWKSKDEARVHLFEEKLIMNQTPNAP